MLLAGMQDVSAQKVFKLNRFVDSVLTVRYHRADIDTNYVTRPQTKWTLMGRFNMSGAKINAKGVQEGKHFESEMKADYKSTVSVGVSYLGLSLNLSINPAKMLGKYHDYELGFRSYGKRFGFDIAYQDASNFKGWQELDGERWDFTTSSTTVVSPIPLLSRTAISSAARQAVSCLPHRGRDSMARWTAIRLSVLR